MTQDVIPRCEIRGHGDGPAIIVRDEHICSPGSRIGAADKTELIDFKPLQCCFVDGLAGAVAVGHVVDDGSFVRIGPGGPLELYFFAGLDGCFEATVCGATVTDYVGRGVGGGGHEAVVEVLGRGPGD